MSLEKDLSQEIRTSRLRQAILSTIASAGVITLAAMAPNVLSLVGKIQRRQHERIKSAVQRLKEKGLLSVGPDGARLTERGEKYLATATLIAQRPTRWDHRWRIVIFDIPEKRKNLRNLLRHNLLSIGFIRLQDSVWIYPYDCEELLTLLKTSYRLGIEVQYIIAEKVEHASKLKRFFNV